VTMITVMIFIIVVIMFFLCNVLYVTVIMEATPAFCCFIYLLVTETLLVAQIRPI